MGSNFPPYSIRQVVMYRVGVGGGGLGCMTLYDAVLHGVVP